MKFIFVHVPKTAGTSFIKRIKDGAFSRDETCFFSGGFGSPGVKVVRGFKGLVKENTSGLRFFSGHLPYGVHPFINGKCHYLTFLRNPIERAVSHYCFVRQPAKDPKKYHHRYRDFFDENDIVEVLRASPKFRFNPFNNFLVDNMQTRFVAGISHYWRSKNSRKMLAVAKRNLEHRFASFGIQESFEKSIKLMEVMTDIPLSNKSSEKRMKVTYLNKEDLLGDVDLSDLDQFHFLDQELYEFGRQLFEKRCSSFEV